MLINDEKIKKMKGILLIALFIIAYNFGNARTKVTAKTVKDHVGQKVEFTDTLKQINTNKKTCYLNFGAKYPNNTFTIVIFAKDFDKFPDRLKWKEGDIITITGKVKLFNEKPEIVLNDEGQIHYIEKSLK